MRKGEKELGERARHFGGESEAKVVLEVENEGFGLVVYAVMPQTPGKRSFFSARPSQAA